MKKEPVKEGSVVRSLSRREVLGLIGAAAATLIGPNCSQSANGEQTSRNALVRTSPCVVRPQQTEGPFYIDEKLNRSDIRSDPSDSSVKQGVPLRLQFNVSHSHASSCSPLPGAIVDIWHCDAQGLYSDIEDEDDANNDTRGKKFLRGYQVTDTNGTAQFTTIYPGWYPGRTVHVHYKIRTDSHEFTSQLYFDESITDQVHSQAPYNKRGRRLMTNSRDDIFRRGGNRLMLQLTKDTQGYTGIFDISLQRV